MASYFSASPAETFFARIYRRVSSKLVRYPRVKVYTPAVSRVYNVNITIVWILMSLPSRSNRKKLGLESVYTFATLFHACCCCCCCFVVVPGWTEELSVQLRSSEQRLRGREVASHHLSLPRPPPIATVLPVLRLDVQSAGDSRPCFAFLRVAHARLTLSLSHPRNLSVHFPLFPLQSAPRSDSNRFDRLRSNNRIGNFSVPLFVRDS